MPPTQCQSGIRHPDLRRSVVERYGRQLAHQLPASSPYISLFPRWRNSIRWGRTPTLSGRPHASQLACLSGCALPRLRPTPCLRAPAVPAAGRVRRADPDGQILSGVFAGEYRPARISTVMEPHLHGGISLDAVWPLGPQRMCRKRSPWSCPNYAGMWDVATPSGRAPGWC